MRSPSFKLADRLRIETMYAQGASVAEIAADLSCQDQNVRRELRRGSTGKLDRNSRVGYSAAIGQARFMEASRRKGRKIAETVGV